MVDANNTEGFREGLPHYMELFTGGLVNSTDPLKNASMEYDSMG